MTCTDPSHEYFSWFLSVDSPDFIVKCDTCGLFMPDDEPQIQAVRRLLAPKRPQ